MKKVIIVLGLSLLVMLGCGKKENETAKDTTKQETTSTDAKTDEDNKYSVLTDLKVGDTVLYEDHWDSHIEVTLNQVFKSEAESIKGYISDLRNEGAHYFIFEFTLKNVGTEEFLLKDFLINLNMENSITTEVLDGDRVLRIFDEDNEEMLKAGEEKDLTYLYISDALEGSWGSGDPDRPDPLSTIFQYTINESDIQDYPQ